MTCHKIEIVMFRRVLIGTIVLGCVAAALYGMGVATGRLRPPVSPAQLGHWQAVFDTWRGRRILKIYGTPELGAAEWEWILWSRYRIRCELVGGCRVSSEQAENAEAYNQVTERWIAEQYGPKLLEATRHRAMDLFFRKCEAAQSAKQAAEKNAEKDR